MWLTVNLEHFTVEQSGFRMKTVGMTQVYTSDHLTHLTHINQLKTSEYGQMVTVDAGNHQVWFGRDYLGHYPLLYAERDKTLILSDSIQKMVQWYHDHHHSLTFSEQALALYFSMGYVPHGMTLFQEIHACENTSVYHWKNSQIARENLFTPIEMIPDLPIVEIDWQINNQIKKLVSQHPIMDVWCSGGIDSSIMATVCRRHSVNAALLTLNYDEEVIASRGEAELPFVRAVSQYCDLPLHHATLNQDDYREIFQALGTGFISPSDARSTIPKYLLARHTRAAAITGEGGDQLFSGIKNNFVFYMQKKYPDFSLGRIYALAHYRHFGKLDQIMTSGKDWQAWISDYFMKIIERYPGPLMRKMLYTDTFLKLGSLIFAESYYPGQRYQKKIFHPLTGLEVYQAAFSLDDHHKYEYPHGKIVLAQLYQDQLPEMTVKRKKSGTQLPLELYSGYLGDQETLAQYLLPLKNVPYLQEKLIDDTLSDIKNVNYFLLHSLMVLGCWLTGLQGK